MVHRLLLGMVAVTLAVSLGGLESACGGGSDDGSASNAPAPTSPIAVRGVGVGGTVAGATAPVTTLGQGGSTGVSPTFSGTGGVWTGSGNTGLGLGGTTTVTPGCPATAPPSRQECLADQPCLYAGSTCYCTGHVWSCLTVQGSNCPASQPQPNEVCPEKTIHCMYALTSCICDADPADRYGDTGVWSCQ